MCSGSRSFVRYGALLTIAMCASLGSYAQSSLPVVPGGEGFGMTTRAAYGCGANPAILRVTNLNDSGAGSLRDALTATGPRVVIFEISGTIVLGSDINITEPCLTIAGQTAPSPGITLRDGGLNFYAHDVLVQHLRIRPGDGGPVLPPTAGHDALLVYSAYGFSAHDIIFDHLSVSWAGGKNTSILSYANPTNVTFWHSIISEALYWSRNIDDLRGSGGPGSLGQLIAARNVGVSIIGNLFAHNSDRNPEVHEGSVVHFINNVVYDWGKDATNYQWATFFYAPEPGPWKASVVGNKYIAGPPPSPVTPLYAVGVWSGESGSQLYMVDNAIDQSRQAVVPYMNNLWFDPLVSTPPASLAGITVRSSSIIESFVLTNAGARPLDRDAVDNRIVSEVTNRTGGVISSQNNVGGWPALAVNSRPLSLPANPHAVTSSGYTNLETWLHGYAAALEPRSESAPPSLTAPTHVRLLAN